MQRASLTSIIYLATAIACSLLALGRYADDWTRWSLFLLTWLVVSVVPLLFVFSYSRFLCAASTTRGQRKLAAIVNGIGLTAATILFSFLATPFWKNPLRDLSYSTINVFVAIAVAAIFLVATIFLLLKKKSSLAITASILFWPYWLLIALIFVNRWYEDTGIHAAYYFLCFAAPIPFTFAAGAISRRPITAHAAALAGVVIGTPFLCSDVIKGYGYYNVWLVFNQPNDRFSIYPLYIVPAIFSVALFTFSIYIALAGLLSYKRRLDRTSISNHIWPGLVVCFAVIAVWFSQSVTPYRIPGFVDYDDYPILQILHVQKRGLEFHERCISIRGRPKWPLSISVSGDDRRLFQYRFQTIRASGQIPDPLAEHIQDIIKSSNRTNERREIVKPLRDWNDDAWYFYVRGSGLNIYGTPNETVPPKEVTDLFLELNQLSRSTPTQSRLSELRDICLGFCYDPLSAMGYLYSNHRCFNNGHGVVCQ